MKYYVKNINDEITRGLDFDLNGHNLLKDFTFKEFSLQELGLPSAKVLLESVKEIEREVGIQGWRYKDYESKTYKGFSLTYNPDFHNKDQSIFHQTWGDFKLKQNYGQVKGKVYENGKNTYYDSYGFRQIPNLINSEIGYLFNNFRFSIVRSRVAYLFGYGRGEDKKNEAEFHVDEAPFRVLRLNIPLQTSSEHVLDIIGKDEYGNELNIENKHLEVGKAYMWNTRIPHRITYSKKCESKDPRIHIVLGFSPFYDYNIDDDSFEKNEFFNTKINELILQKNFINSNNYGI